MIGWALAGEADPLLVKVEHCEQVLNHHGTKVDYGLPQQTQSLLVR
jgi:hypothetical protein